MGIAIVLIGRMGEKNMLAERYLIGEPKLWAAGAPEDEEGGLE